ncbi:guanine nucleotide exchange factor [Anaeramoeba flamelloides]|uniref:Guanine nucleotide exchange factor n=1 Tax=Anaeramoeba flamelloides TaxID=1746091 RepID=A0AAV7YIZ4_9EUKA|nr:guanine nucleotide exchange factor [Anaeramoeba flamelloides]
MSKNTKSYKIGDSVAIQNKIGTVKFIGKTGFAPGVWIGIELNQPEGVHDGKLYGKRYFKCNEQHGIFVRVNSSYLNPKTKKSKKKETISPLSVFSPQISRNKVDNKKELIKRIAFQKYIISQYCKEKDQIKTEMTKKEKQLSKKGKKGKKLIKRVNQMEKIFALKQKIEELRNEERHLQGNCIQTENILENYQEELDSRSEDVLSKRFLELEMQKKLLNQKIEDATEKKIELDQSNKQATDEFTHLMEKVESEKDEVSKIYKIRKQEIKQIQKQKKEILKSLGNNVTQKGKNIFELADRINQLNKSISAGKKKTIKLEKSRKNKDEKRSKIEQENQNRKSQWLAKLMNNRPEILEFRERITPIYQNESLGRLKTAEKSLNRNILNSEDILQLIMQHYDIEKRPSIIKFIENQTGIKYVFQEQPESMLISFIRVGVNENNKKWDILHQEEDSLEDNQDEEIDVGRNIVLSLDDEDINIWDEPKNNQKNIRIEKEDLKKYQNGDFFSSIYLSNINKLIEHLIHPDHFDKKFMETFLITYHEFLKPEHLFLKIVQRYRVPSLTTNETKTKTEKESETEIEKEKEKEKEKEIEKENEIETEKDNKNENKMEISIQKRTITVLDSWVDTQFSDFGPILIEQLLSFLENEVKQNYPKESQNLITKIQTLQENKNHSKLSGQNYTKKDQPPDPIIPKTLFSVNFTLSDVKPIEIARQMTLFFHQLFSKIQPDELIEYSINRKTKKDHKSQNIIKMIKKFNDVSLYVTEQIVSQKTLRRRAAQFVRWINVCELLREMNNFDSLLMIVRTMNNSNCKRLKVTRSEVSKNHWKSFDNLIKDVKSIEDVKKYKDILKTCKLPALPYFGAFKSDLTYVSDDSSSTIEGLINFRKRKSLYNIMREIKKYQKVAYNFIPIYQIQELFKQRLCFKNEKLLYEISLQNEPRGSTRTSLN